MIACPHRVSWCEGRRRGLANRMPGNVRWTHWFVSGKTQCELRRVVGPGRGELLRRGVQFPYGGVNRGGQGGGGGAVLGGAARKGQQWSGSPLSRLSATPRTELGRRRARSTLWPGGGAGPPARRQVRRLGARPGQEAGCDPQNERGQPCPQRPGSAT